MTFQTRSGLAAVGFNAYSDIALMLSLPFLRREFV